jgi:hypothetical protein
VPDADRGGVHQGEEQTESKNGRQNGHGGPISTQLGGVLQVFVPETRLPLGRGRSAISMRVPTGERLRLKMYSETQCGRSGPHRGARSGIELPMG